MRLRNLILILLLFAVCRVAEAADLAKIDRKIAKEPKYEGQPLYSTNAPELSRRTKNLTTDHTDGTDNRKSEALLIRVISVIRG